MATVVSDADAAILHEQMQGKDCSILYAFKDTSLLPQLEYSICVVHIARTTVQNEKFTQAVTYFANLYLGADDAPLYVLHVSEDSNKLDISFADTSHAPALVEEIEQRGISPFLRAFARAYEAPQCNMAYLYYDPFTQLEEFKPTVAMGHNIPLPLAGEEHSALHKLLRVCSQQ